MFWPSRNFAVYVRAVMVMRCCPSRPVVIGMVKVLPSAFFHRANRSPLRVMISALGGSGLVAVLRNTVPTSLFLSLHDCQSEVLGQPIGHVEPQALLARGEL